MAIDGGFCSCFACSRLTRRRIKLLQTVLVVGGCTSSSHDTGRCLCDIIVGGGSKTSQPDCSAARNTMAHNCSHHKPCAGHEMCASHQQSLVRPACAHGRMASGEPADEPSARLPQLPNRIKRWSPSASPAVRNADVGHRTWHHVSSHASKRWWQRRCCAERASPGSRSTLEVRCASEDGESRRDIVDHLRVSGAISAASAPSSSCLPRRNTGILGLVYTTYRLCSKHEHGSQGIRPRTEIAADEPSSS